MTRDDRASDSLLSPLHRWQLRSGTINEVVNAPDQWAAWNTLRNRPLSDFGLIVTAEADENGDPIPVHTASLLFSWHRDQDAQALISLAIEHGLPDTTATDIAIAREHGRQ